MQGTRAKHSSGLTGGNTGGQDRRFLTGTVIGPGQTADRILTNPGHGNNQLILKNSHGATHATQIEQNVSNSQIVLDNSHVTRINKSSS